MGRWPVLALGVALIVAGCSERGVQDAPPATAFEAMSGPAWYLLRVEPDAAIDTRDIVLTTDQGAAIRPRDLLGPTDLADSGGADIFALDGRRLVTKIGLPAALEATVDGRRCDGSVELMEDMESDATLVIGDDGCALRLDTRHRMGAVDHGLSDDARP